MPSGSLAGTGAARGRHCAPETTTEGPFSLKLRLHGCPTSASGSPEKMAAASSLSKAEYLRRRYLEGGDAEAGKKRRRKKAAAAGR